MSGVFAYPPATSIVDQDCLQDHSGEDGVSQGFYRPPNIVPSRLDGLDRRRPLSRAGLTSSSTRVNIEASDARADNAYLQSGFTLPLLHDAWYDLPLDTAMPSGQDIADGEHTTPPHPSQDTVQETSIIAPYPEPVHPPAPSTISLSPLVVTQSGGQNGDVMHVHYSGDSLHAAQRLMVATPSHTRAAMSRRAPTVNTLHHCPYRDCGATLTRLSSLKGTRII
ncbi:uncharacterized protein SCHCODRAFT_02591277 [Schizophyllum commune H4-8]|nr:uncharacterized protein SCHCODRAFT_02591277 [Schizophyllum commune H4-8]KAI5887392.1 hypothetical protein SCHCODRAFT_02591277 [Schizophyllum commune H4-8]